MGLAREIDVRTIVEKRWTVSSVSVGKAHGSLSSQTDG
jgi:hypothetical protein